MKKAAACLLGMVLLAACGEKRSRVDKVYENGVEIVLNYMEPYVLPGVPSSLELEEAMVIDTESEAIAKTGLTAIQTFSLDRGGNIYLMMRQSPGMFIYKFDSEGKFLTSFGRKGQGPGEFEYGGDIAIDEENRVIAKDTSKEKFFIFTKDGVLIEEVKFGKNLNIEKYLGMGKLLTWWQEQDPAMPVIRNHYFISDDTLSENREFYTFEFDDPFRAPRYKLKGKAIILGASDKNIFIGDSTGGYEILVFDSSGKILRKIRKDFLPVLFPEDYKAVFKKVMGRSALGQDRLKRTDFPADLPPFRFLFADDQGRLYVMTNEREGERKYWYDIFSREGAFVGRFLFDNVQVVFSKGERYYDESLNVIVKGDRLYALREKDSGFMTLTAYKMKWK